MRGGFLRRMHFSNYSKEDGWTMQIWGRALQEGGKQSQRCNYSSLAISPNATSVAYIIAGRKADT